MKLSKHERETIINFNEAEPTASVYTHNKALRRKLDKPASTTWQMPVSGTCAVLLRKTSEIRGHTIRHTTVCSAPCSFKGEGVIVGDLLRGLASLSHGRLGSAKRFHACDEGYWADFSVGRRPPKYKLSPPPGIRRAPGLLFLGAFSFYSALLCLYR